MDELNTQRFDVVLIGSGLGGLLTAALLSKEGFQVLVLEKNKQIGGALQSFALDGKLFESAVHYIGSMKEGETLHQLYSYLGIQDKLHLQQLDGHCYDEIILGDKSYSLAQGHTQFVDQLSHIFPQEHKGIKDFVSSMQYVCDHFPLYRMRLGTADEKQKVIHLDLQHQLQSRIQNATLQQVLCGNNLLFAGQLETTPFYLYALVQNSYIESSFKFKKGSAQLAKVLQDIIHQHGGRVQRNTEVVRMQEEDGRITYVEDQTGCRYAAKHIISNLHPAETYRLLPTKLIKPITRKRIQEAENTHSAFMVNVSLKEKMLPYTNHNLYYHLEPDVWKDLRGISSLLPNSYGIYFYPDAEGTHAHGLSILTYMHGQDVPFASDTFRTTALPSSRGEAYEEWKQNKIDQILEQVFPLLPKLKSAIVKTDACTPLSYRDYLHTPEGSMYGFRKQVHDLAQTTYSSRTKISNLYLTGQNINLHGVLGVSITAVLTAAEFVGLDYLVNKIRNSNQGRE